MSKIYHENDATLEILENKTVSIIGYGNQGRSLALNLRDSGINVVVGNPEDEYAPLCREDNFDYVSIAKASELGDIVMVLLPDEVTPEIYLDEISKGITSGKTLGFASGYCVCYDQISFPEDVNVIMVAPRMLGELCRTFYLEGKGYLSMISVHQDFDGKALEITLALAKGIGSLKDMVMETTFKDETELDLFTEQALLPAFAVALKSAVEILIDSDYNKMESMLELYMSTEIGDVLKRAGEIGFVGQSSKHSPTSHYGTKSRMKRFEDLNMKPVMEKVLKEIQSGDFAEEWSKEKDNGYKNFQRMVVDFDQTKFAKAEKEILEDLGRKI